MKKLFTFFLSFFCMFNIFANGNIQYVPKDAIQPYVTFLNSSRVSNPRDYIIKLFETYDIVVLAEADHRETTQWDFIYDLVSDPRFIRKVGNMFTEYGSVYLQPQLEAFLNAPTLDRTAVLQMLRNFMPAQEGWDHNNFYDFLQKLYLLNSGLSKENKINLFFSDEPASWDEFVAPYPYHPNKYDVFYAIPPQGDFINPRDRIMAMRIYTKYKALVKTKALRQKALVIMNSRHGFGYLPQMDDPENGIAYLGQNVAGYLMQWLPNPKGSSPPTKVANVMMHTASPSHLLQDGKWDAAFLCIDNKAVGFDFKGSPFGADTFDYGQIPSAWGNYQDIFTGIIFYQPLESHFYCTNIEGFYDDAYKALVKQRALSTCGEDCYEKIRMMWDDMDKHPENYCYAPYDSKFMGPMYKWVYDDVQQQ